MKSGARARYSIILALPCLFCCVAAAFAAPVYSNSIGMEFMRIPAGTFVMGGEDGDSAPRHTVTITKPFYLGICEVTQAQWNALLVKSPSRFKGESNPVENVSWEEAQQFIATLNLNEGTNTYRLPTEAEWEYAARAGERCAFPSGEDTSGIGFYAWHNFNSGGTSHPVGIKRPNAFGLHDMQGNVSEWVRDWYAEDYYAQSPAMDPSGPETGGRRVARGCAWRHDAGMCGYAGRFTYEPGESKEFIGLRLVREIE